MSFLRRHRAATAVTAVCAAVASTVVVLALSADGYETRHVSLNDGGIWVTSDKDGLYGRLNRPAGALDLALNPPGGAQASYRLDVRQQDAAVVEWDQGSGKLLPVDVASGKVIEDQGVPVSADEQVAINGGTIAVLSPGTNQVWATRIDPAAGITSLAAIDPSAKPVLKFGASAVDGNAPRAAGLAVGSDGTVYAANALGDVATVRPDGARFAKASYRKLGQTLRSVQVSAVGTSMVVYDPVQGTVFLPSDQSATVKADPDAALQAPSASGSEVVLATTTQLLAVPLGGGKPVSLFDGGSGAPAAPTWLGDCVHSAWAGNPGVYARACGGDVAKQLVLPHQGALSDPVFRVNRDSILLNDLALGSVYDLATLQQVDDWSAVKPPPVVRTSDKNKNNNTSVATRDLPPKAVDDTLGARPGRTTVLHVLDNDSDPQGAILSISRVSGLDDPGARVQTAPDGQSIEVTLPAKDARDVHFKYTVDDGKGLTADAAVSVEVRQPDANEAPHLRHGFQQSSFSVSAGGTLDLPVLDDWRDFDGDPLVVTAASVPSGTVTTSPDGRVNFVAPATGSNETLVYKVADGQGATVSQRVPLTVLGPTSNKTAPPVAEPDIARGQVGKPITIEPLANDLPGADPTNPAAALAIAGAIASPAGVRVNTDLKSGTVTVDASRHGTFVLDYTASFGNARYAHATIRVDVADAPATPQPPVAVPDTGVLYGQTATTIDVLANDFDPAGGVLVVQHAQPADSDQVQVSIVDGHWLRVESRVDTIDPNPQVIQYTITDGLTAPVNGELTVTQVPPPKDDTPLAVDDYATVRSGDSALIPVLDNDIDPTGAALSLLDDVPNAPNPGALTVIDGDGSRTAGGAAFVAAKEVRYVAPAVAQQTTATISYVVRNPTGQRATGIVHVTIVPPPTPKRPDQPPAAQPINARAVSGDTVRIKIPTTGIDPDGDTANVSGITSAPTLGRIVSIGATSITYEAFPTESGTDRFGYEVTDTYGKSSTSTISVGIATASDPQPPAAVDDNVTAPPGAKVRVDVLGNDVIAPDDSVAIGDLRAINPELPSDTKLVGRGGPLQVVAPATNGRTSVVLYSVSDGVGDPSTGTVTIRSQQGYVPPPIAVDVPATPGPGDVSATVDVLKKASDPELSPLRIAKVFDPRATIAGGTVRVPVLDRVQNVVFEIANAKGATAAAVIHVPARGVGDPYAKAGKLITIPRDGSKTVDIGDYVVDPAGKPVRLTTTDQLGTAPATGLRVSSPDTTHLTLTGRDGYNGPAAISFQVTDGKSLDDPAGRLALITVQVQVGPDTPVLRCPSAPVDVVEGGDPRRLDITALCHVWLGDRSRLGQLEYTASWTKRADSVAILGSGSHLIGVQAEGGAQPGDTGAIDIGVKGTQAEHSTINVAVLKLGKASIDPIVIDGFKAGSTATRDVRGFVNSPLRDPHVAVVRITQTSGMAAKTAISGSRVSITPGADSHGLMRFRLVVTDVADTSRTDRQIAGSLTLEVLNVPDAPGRPQAGRTVLSQTVDLSWPTPADNGAQIDWYRVEWPGGAQTCAASPCRITGLRNGTSYAFTVRAHNAVGYSKPSAQLAPPAKPDKLPAAVAHLTAANPQDHTLTLTWTPVNNGGTAVRTYQVNWSGGGATTVPGTAHSVVASGLDNHNVYTFTVVAINELGAGPPASTQGQSAGAPSTPAGVGVQYADAAGTTTRTVRVSWNPVDPNGAGPATYTVTRDGGAICNRTPATSCTDTPATGKTYTYSVVAYNAAEHPSAAGTARFAVAGTPDTIGGLSAVHTAHDGQLTVHYTVPNSHGAQSTIHCSASPGGGCGSWTPGGAPGTADAHVVSGLPNDADVTITLHDCNGQYCGADSSAPAAHTDGPPHQPNVSCSTTSTDVHFNWSAPKPINGYTVSKFQISVDGGGYNTTTATFKAVGGKDGKTHTISVKSVDSRGETSSAASASCKDPAAPDPRKLTISMGGPITAFDCTSGCHYIRFAVSGFTPNHGYSVTISDNPGDYVRHYSFTTNGSGDYGPAQPGGYYGGPHNGGFGTIDGSVDGTGVTDSCYGNWQDGGGCQ